MSISRTRWVILTVFCAVALLGTLTVLAQSRAVDLEVFIVEPTNDGRLELFFETGSESSTAGFFFVRGNTPNDPVFNAPSPTLAIPVRHQGNIVTFIPAAGGGAGSGATYDAFDENVTNDQQYCYMIGEEEVDGSIAYYTEDILCGTVGDIAFAQLEASTSDLSGKAGTVISHTLMLTNTGNRASQYILTVPTKVWATSVLTPIVFIPAGQTFSTTVRVTIPSGENGGATDTAIVRASLNDNPNQPPVLPAYSITTTIKTAVNDQHIFLPITLRAP